MTQLSSDISKVRFFCSSEKARLDTRRLIKVGSTSALLLALMVTLETAGLAHAEPPASRPNDFVRNLHASDRVRIVPRNSVAAVSSFRSPVLRALSEIRSNLTQHRA